jgi:hypothetical protein
MLGSFSTGTRLHVASDPSLRWGDGMNFVNDHPRNVIAAATVSAPIA